jgi:predicted nucleotidyltransferase component of viral defense system
MMINTSTQLKALVRNQSGGDSSKAQLIIRNYIMGRLLVRVSKTSYRDNIIIKGGALIASIVGVDKRSTMDIDSTIQNLDLSEDNILEMIEKIIAIDAEDNVTFEITSTETIMEEMDYPGIRVKINARIDSMQTPIILDFSAGDIITPRAIEYSYKLMFNQGDIKILAYNLETVLAEKFETIISRSIANTRMRDFYDIYTLLSIDSNFDYKNFNSALINTSMQRGSYETIRDWSAIINEIEREGGMKKLWSSYQSKFDYAENVSWKAVVESIRVLGNNLVL